MDSTSDEDETLSIPGSSRAKEEQRSRPRSIQPEAKRLKITNKKFESILYKEKWHAIKASKDFFKDSRNVVDLMLFKASEVNTSVPIACDDELAFLVDTSELELGQDLKCDGTGRYKNSSHTKTEVVVDDNQNVFWLKERFKPGSQRYTLIRTYCTHRDNPGFCRKIEKLQKEGVLDVPIVLIRYEWKEQMATITPTAHVKCNQSTSPSIKSKKSSNEELTEPSSQSTQGRPDDKFQKQGGTVVTDAVASLQRDRQKISQHDLAVKKQIDYKKLVEKKQFVRSIEMINDRSKGLHHRCVVCTDKQIEDMERACTAGSIISFAGTFDLGQMFVTAASYRLNKRNEKNVLMPGPFLVHEKKDADTYQYFGSHISKSLRNEQVPVFKTDGERVMYKGLRSSPSFSKAKHMLCLIDHRRHVESKLQKLGLQKYTDKILRTIYGEQGLVNCEDGKDYEEDLQIMNNKWNRLEAAETGKDPEFATWFRKYKSQGVKECLVKPTRQQTGLGDPHRHDCECMISLLPKRLDGKKSWNDIVDSLEEFVKSKYMELDQASQ